MGRASHGPDSSVCTRTFSSRTFTPSGQRSRSVTGWLGLGTTGFCNAVKAVKRSSARRWLGRFRGAGLHADQEAQSPLLRIIEPGLVDPVPVLGHAHHRIIDRLWVWQADRVADGLVIDRTVRTAVRHRASRRR